MQEKSTPQTNKTRTEATTAALITAARGLFAEKGYAESSTPEVVRAAGVTRGALYHHFADKVALFRAVVTQEFESVAAEINTGSKDAASTNDALRLGSRAFLAAMDDPGRVRIMLLDGPAVLGKREIDRIDQETSADALRQGLLTAMASGEIKTLPIDALTVQLSALFDRAALAVSEGDSADEHLKVLDAIFESLA